MTLEDLMNSDDLQKVRAIVWTMAWLVSHSSGHQPGAATGSADLCLSDFEERFLVDAKDEDE